jgi:hypothetical protein
MNILSVAVQQSKQTILRPAKGLGCMSHPLQVPMGQTALLKGAFDPVSRRVLPGENFGLFALRGL